MAKKQGRIKWPGLNGFITAEYTKALGITPGVCMVLSTPTIHKEQPRYYGDLEITDGGTKRTLKNCRLAEIHCFLDQGGMFARFAIQDRRWQWLAGGEISGRYNLRRPNLDRKRLVDPAETIDEPTEKSLKELAKLCLDAMGEQNAVLGNLPDKPRPLIEWDAENPAQALSALIEPHGFAVSLRWDDRVELVKLGEGRKLPNGGEQLREETLELPAQPGGLKVYCGPSHYQTDLVLEAWGRELDGRLKPIDELSYKPANGWEKSAPGYHHDVVDPAGRGEKWNRIFQELARTCIYRLWRIPNTPKTPKNQAVKVAGVSITRREDLLPLMDHQILTKIDPVSGKEVFLAPVLWGAFVDGQAFGGGSATLELNNFNVATLPESHVPPPGPEAETQTFRISSNLNRSVRWRYEFSIDGEQGLVELDRPAWLYTTSGSDKIAMPARLALRTGITLRDQETRIPLRHSLERDLFGLQQGKQRERRGGDVRIYRQDELYAIFRPEYDADGYQKTGSQGETDNLKDLDKQLEEYLLDAAKQYQLPQGETRRYGGLIDVDTDGAIRQVGYSITEAGAFTMASFNSEYANLLMGWSERRFLETYNRRSLDKLWQVSKPLMNAVLEPASGTARELMRGRLG